MSTSSFKDFYKQYILIREAAQDKVNKIQSIAMNQLGDTLSSPWVNLIMKRESSFDWNKIFSNPDNAIDELIQQNNDIITNNLNKAGNNIKPFLDEFYNYTSSNNYNKAFMSLFIFDFIKKYKNTRSAIPNFETHIIGDLAQKVKDMDTFGNLVSLYNDLNKESVTGGSSSLKNQWLVINSQKSDPDNYERNLEKLMTYSSCKTGWCVRGKGMASHYLKESDFHLYLDNDGDAVVSLRLRNNEINEISGTEDGSDQTVSEEFIPITIKYVNENNYTIKSDGEVADFTYDENVKDTGGNLSFMSGGYTIATVIEDYHNYQWYVDVITGNENLNYFGSDYELDELWRILNKEQVMHEMHEDENVEENDQYDELDYLTDKFGLDYGEVYSRMLESTAYDNISREVMDVIKDINSLDIIKTDIKSLDDKIELISKEEYTELFYKLLPELNTTMSIERFFEEGQPQIQFQGEYDDDFEYLGDHVELHLLTYIDSYLEDIHEPQGGWDEWDDAVLEELLFEEYPELKQFKD